MNRINRMLGVVVGVSTWAVSSALAVEVGQVVVRQNWPWSAEIKVDYVLTGVTEPTDVAVQAFDGTRELVIPPEAIRGGRYEITESGLRSFVIDPVVAFGGERTAIADFKVKLTTSASDPSLSEVLYKIFDLQTGSCQDVTRADFLNGKMGAYETDYTKIDSRFVSTSDDVFIWTGITNDVSYATTKMVMRRVKAKGKKFLMGSPANETFHKASETQHEIELVKDYFIAVYPFTFGQAKCFATAVDRGGALFLKNNPAVKDKLFVTFARVYEREDECPCGINYPIGVRGVDVRWPRDSHTVDDYSLVHKMRERLGVQIDLPTEAEWEFACRAGTTAAYYTGLNTYTAYEEFSWLTYNAGKMVHPVGAKKPNAWGLYDLGGNGGEACLDFFTEKYESLGSVDVGGPEKGDIVNSQEVHVLRSCPPTYTVENLRNAARMFDQVSGQEGFNGVRFVLEVDE